MAGQALILGGTGQIGRAVAGRLGRAGWRVRLADRGSRPLPGELTELEVERATIDREEPQDLRRAVGHGVDVLVDTVAYTASHGLQLASLAGRVGGLVVISSASVYVDDEGRTLDEATSDADCPRLPVPVPEEHATVAPGPATYSTRKVALERVLLEQDAVPATVLRPCAIHGPGSRNAREWYFVKRALDRRAAVVLAHGGQSTFHTTSVENLAELVRLAAEDPGRRVLNCGDPDPPTVLAIARAVAGVMDHPATAVLLLGPPPSAGIGDTPWSVPAEAPFVLAMDAARRELGYAPVTSYEESVGATCRWLVEATRGREWREVLPDLARHQDALFDYDAEDDWLRQLTAPAG